MVAAAIGGAAVAGLAGSVMSSGAAKDAASTQANAANRASDMSLAQQQQTREDLSPYRDTGANATGMLTNRLGDLTAPITMDQATLEKTPGYQFTRNQGLKAVQNGAASRGLGVSGAAMKGAADYATGLADKTYTDQFNLENTNRTNAFNRLYQTASLGENAAAQTGNLGQAATNSATNALTSGANATAAGTVGAANAISGGLNGASSNAMSYLMLNKLTGGGGFGSIFGGGSSQNGGTPSITELG